VRIFLLSVTSTEAVSGRFKSMRTSFPTRTHRYMSFKETHSPGEECVSVVRDERFHKNSDYLWSIFWTSSFINFNTWHLIYNNFKLNFIYYIICLYACVCTFSLHQESPDMILEDQPLISKVVLSHCPHSGSAFFGVLPLNHSTHHVSVFRFQIRRICSVFRFQIRRICYESGQHVYPDTHNICYETGSHNDK
jgi:hypothetical protein